MSAIKKTNLKYVAPFLPLAPPLPHTNLSSVVDLRTTVDDNLAASMGALGYTQEFGLVDLKIALGYLSALIAAAVYFADKKYGFAATYWWTVAGVVAYFALSAALWVVATRFRDVKYVGRADDGTRVTVATWTEKYTPVYRYRVSVGGRTQSGGFDFTKLFDGLGYYKEEELTRLLRHELGKKDL
jgi:signal peptidase complex subunit 2